MEFAYTGGRPVLDFVGTLSDRGGAAVERLLSWDDVVRWIDGAGLGVADLEGGDRDVPRIRALREALYAVVAAPLTGVRAADADRVAVNTAAAAAGRTPELSPSGDVGWTGGLDAVLATVARDGLALLASADVAALRQCSDPSCTRLFVDRSRGGRRRWCGMKGCGDRAKAAAYRSRRRRASPERPAASEVRA